MSTQHGTTNNANPSHYENAVFVSYKWGGEGEEIVNQIEQALQARGIRLIRDKRDLGFKGSIRKFMERMGRGVCVIAVLNDGYLRSKHCMFELMEIAEAEQFHDRVFPVVLEDADIYDPVKIISYVKYWEAKQAELNEKMKTVDQANLQGIRDEIDLYDRIRDEISGLISILRDMNTLASATYKTGDYTLLVDAVEQKLSRHSVFRVRDRFQSCFAQAVLWGFIGTILAALITAFGPGLIESMKNTPVPPTPIPACVTADDILVRLQVWHGQERIATLVPSGRITIGPDITVDLKVDFQSVSGKALPTLECTWDNANSENITSPTEGELLHTDGCNVDYQSGHTKITDTLSLQVSQESCPDPLSYAFFIFPK